MFDSICYKHVSDVRRRKLDDKSEHMVLVGYHITEAYMLFDPINDKILMSQDIVIYENYVWDWNSGDAINKPLICYDVKEVTDEVEVGAVRDIPGTVEVEEGVASVTP